MEPKLWMRARLLRIKRWGQTPFILRLAQQAKLRKLMAILPYRVAYYQQMRGLPFEHYPIIDKSVVQEYFQKLNSFNWSLEQAATMARTCPESIQAQWSTATGGCYLYSDKEMQVALADFISKVAIGPYDKVAVFYLSMKPYFPTCNQRWRFFSLQQLIGEQLSTLQKHQPTILIAPAQTLLLLAQQQKTQKINLQLKKIIATSEVLTSMEEEFIFENFHQPVTHLYQAAEGWLGNTCRYGTLHLNEDLFLIEKEWVDPSRERFIPVITTLTRYLQPLIRYRMEDILHVKPACSCGSALFGVEKIIERCEDVLYFPARRHRQVLKPVYFENLQDAIAQAGKIQHFQIVQHSPSDIAIKLPTRDSSLQARVIEQLEALWQRQEVLPPRVTFGSLDGESGQTFKHTVRELHSTVA